MDPRDRILSTDGTMWSVEQLEARLQGKLRGRIHDLEVRCNHSGIVLRGFARTYYAKQLAQHAVQTETQVPILANEIEVA